MEIGYWKIRGLGAPLRMMFHYAQTEFKDVQYVGEGDGEKWFGAGKERILQINPMANLPYVILDDAEKTCICQSIAVYVAVADKLGLYGGLRDLELLTEINDLRNAHVNLVYPFFEVARTKEEYEIKAVKQCETVALTHYAKFEKVLERNEKKKYLLGDAPRASDFHVWEMLDQHEALAKKHDMKSPLSDFPKLSAYYVAFRAEPTLQEYFASPDYALPINDASAGAFFS